MSKKMIFDLSLVNGEAMLLNAVKAIRDKGGRPVVQILDEKRTLPQNALFHAMYKEIAAAKGDMTFDEVRRHCKLHVGVPILRRDSTPFKILYDKSIRPHLTYEEKLLAMDILPVTRLMEKHQGTEYIDSVCKFWADQGVFVSLPGDMY